jgi:hypothetical protein
MSNEKPIFEIPDNLDEMTDIQYENFRTDWLAFHKKYYPNDTIYLPRRKTQKEHEEERLRSVEFDKKYGSHGNFI